MQWKVQIYPTSNGLRIRTQSQAKDVAADIVERAVIEALLKLKKRLERVAR